MRFILFLNIFMGLRMRGGVRGKDLFVRAPINLRAGISKKKSF
jgi:hypothetical protein